MGGCRNPRGRKGPRKGTEPDRSEVRVLEGNRSAVGRHRRAIPSFNDEALSGEWKGHRSSRLSLQYRVVYRVEADTVTVYVVRVSAHDYRR
ncbi:MAG: type II toxin-antitoxin system RelE/ParE family toxin [Polyangiaceae bacterium]